MNTTQHHLAQQVSLLTSENHTLRKHIAEMQQQLLELNENLNNLLPYVDTFHKQVKAIVPDVYIVSNTVFGIESHERDPRGITFEEFPHNEVRVNLQYTDENDHWKYLGRTIAKDKFIKWLDCYLRHAAKYSHCDFEDVKEMFENFEVFEL
jgi:hypothetical protein